MCIGYYIAWLFEKQNVNIILNRLPCQKNYHPHDLIVCNWDFKLTKYNETININIEVLSIYLLYKVYNLYALYFLQYLLFGSVSHVVLIFLL